jgi:putative FmdB family regulatory protein
MPIYEYRCLECGKISEVFLHTPNSDSIECPICGSKNVERLLSASYAIKMGDSMLGRTCCGRMERCEAPPCSTEGICRRDK